MQQSVSTPHCGLVSLFRGIETLALELDDDMRANPYISPASESTHVEHAGRPVIITALCVVGFLLFAISFKRYLTIIVPIARQTYGEAMATCLVATWVLTIVSFVGYWRMAKWGVWLYGILIVVGTGFGIANSIPFNAVGIIVPGLVLTIGMVYYKRMQWRADEWPLSRSQFPWRSTIFYFYTVASPIAVLLLAEGRDVLPLIPARLLVLIAPPFIIAFLVAATQFAFGFGFRRRFFGILSNLEILFGILWIFLACMGYSIEFANATVSAE
jgi:uncharacterized membrane protein YidH (DUF202 family)